MNHQQEILLIDIKKHRDNGIKKITKVTKSMEQTKMANKIWKALIKNWRTVFARESNKVIDICPVCGNDKSKTARNKAGQTVCEATENDCK